MVYTKFMKRKIIIGIVVLLSIVVAGVIYGFMRQRTFGGADVSGSSSLPEANPFEKKINPFDSYKNPFDPSTSLEAGFELAQVISADAITFPIVELGNCASEAACRAYCNQMTHIDVCLDFAEARGLLSAAEIEEGRRFAKAGGAGPGGCADRTSCESYCNNLANIEECVAFAERTGVLAPNELAEAQNIARFLREGGTLPAGCVNKESCMAACKMPANMRVCLDFAERANLISPQELAEARKVLPFLERGETPGGCAAKKECDAYCVELAHMEECLAFAEKAGLIPEEELRMAKKVVPLMIRGETPGRCKSKEACESYCGSSAHWEECLVFAEKIGLFNKAELLILRQAIKLMPKQR